MLFSSLACSRDTLPANETLKLTPSPQTMAEAASFSIYSGNESLPPQYQDVTRISGRFDDGAKTVAVNYTRSKEEQAVNREVTLYGADYEQLRKTVRKTSVVDDSESRGVGGGAFVVTLKDASGRSIYGSPSNASDWRSVIAMIEGAPLPPP
jgi:hypothetical protein